MRTIARRFRGGMAFALPLALTTLAVSGPAGPTAVAAERDPEVCGAGRLCIWQRPDFQGAHRAYELADVDIESCVRLPLTAGAESLVQRMGRPVSVYQDAHCDSTGEFTTYPTGSWVPETEFAVRAFKVWER